MKKPRTTAKPTTSATTTATPATTNADDPAGVRKTWLTHTVPLAASLSQIDREWLITNGTGAFAMGTVLGINTRRYHGLLIAATRPPVGRVVALSQVFEHLTLSKAGQSQSVEFSTLEFPGSEQGPVFAPQGYKLLEQFERGIGVRWAYRWGDVRFTRELHLHWKEQAATLRYTIRGYRSVGKATLRLAPMLTLRDFHSLVHKDGYAHFQTRAGRDGVVAKRNGVAVHLACPGAEFSPADDWWYSILYRADAERGQDCREDYHLPGGFVLDLTDRDEADLTLTVTLGEKGADPSGAEPARRAAHLQPIVAAIDKDKDPSRIHRTLAIAADDFVVDRTIQGERLSTILAGYPWFADWGRDTFIALPGLMLSTGRFAEARATLHVFARNIRDGLVPNRFDDYDDSAAHYNAVDAPLWFVNAAVLYYKTSGDDGSWNGWLREAVLKVIDAFIRGTSVPAHGHGEAAGIRMAGDGLITAGSPRTQLTWMDAACGDCIFTPRFGKSVEINALWYNALASVAEFVADSHPPVAAHYTKLLGRIKRSYAKVFWDESLGYLRDTVWTDEHGHEHADPSLRPNQVFAASLPHSPLPRTKQQQMLAVVKQNLLTPFGLRTLPPHHPAYHGRYTGPQFQRDKAYHQGTVWPWLIGPYAEAVLRVGQYTAEAKREAYRAIEPLLEQLAGSGLGQLHEIHEADPPHRPVGCTAQAWSVAEVLRVYKLL